MLGSNPRYRDQGFYTLPVQPSVHYLTFLAKTVAETVDMALKV